MPPISAHPSFVPASSLHPMTGSVGSAHLPMVRLAGKEEIEVPTPRAAVEDAGASWFPSAHLLEGASSGARTRELLLTLEGQARLMDDLLAACAVGAGTLPPSLLSALHAARQSVAAVQGDAGSARLG